MKQTLRSRLSVDSLSARPINLKQNWSLVKKGCISPREEHSFDELIVVVAGKVQITYENLDEPETHEANTLVEVPAGTMHQITFLAGENKLVIIYPDRGE